METGLLESRMHLLFPRLNLKNHMYPSQLFKNQAMFSTVSRELRNKGKREWREK
jgi:hypothetical protein